MVNKRLRDGLIILGIAAWFGAAGAGILLTRARPGVFTEMLAYSLVAPVLVASFFYGRGAGLLVALSASLLSGSLAVGQPEVLDSPIVQRVLFQVIAFNAVALMIGSLAQREREAKTQLETIQDTALVGYALIEADTHIIVNINRYAAEMIGLPRGQIIGRDCFAFLCPDCKRECPITDLKRSLVDAEQTLVKADGTVVPVHKTVTPITLDGQEYLIETFLDISERTRQERELARHAESMAILSEASQQMQTLLDLEGVYATAHDAVQKLMSCDSFVIAILDETGREIEDAYFWDENKRWPHQPYPSGQGLIGFVISSGKPLRVNEWGPEHDNLTGATQFGNTERETQSVLAAPLFNQKGKCFGVISTQADAPNAYSIGQEQALITLASQVSKTIENARLIARLNLELAERKRAEAALSESQARLAGIIHSAMDAIISLDASQRVILFNPAAEQLFGCPAAEALGQPLDRFIPERFRQAHREYIRAFGETNQTSRRMGSQPDLTGLRADGVEFPAEISISQTEMAGQKIYTAIVRDITERRQADEIIRQQIQQMNVLRAIDTAIIQRTDLSLTLNLILDNLLPQLQVDAAAILLYEPATQELRYAAGRGFRTSALQHTRLRLNEGYAGRAASERRMIHLSNLRELKTSFLRSPLIVGEGFETYIGMPLIVKEELEGVLEIFQRAPLDPSPAWIEFLETLARQAAISIDNASLFDGLQRANQEIVRAYDATLEGWARALELRDLETAGHTQRVVGLTLRLARAMGISEAGLEQVRRGALLHDIGKMVVPNGILQKPAPLTATEMEIMRQHPAHAYKILSPIQFLRPALDIPYCHHEKWDGSGYPRGLKGGEIPLVARIFAVVDVWDALTSDRSYRKAWSREKTLDYLREQSGSYFDPQVVEAFLPVLDPPKSAGEA